MATAYNSFTLCEAYVGSICSAKKSIDQIYGFPSRHVRGGDKKQKCGCDLASQAGREIKSSPLSTQTTFVKQFLLLHL